MLIYPLFVCDGRWRAARGGVDAGRLQPLGRRSRRRSRAARADGVQERPAVRIAGPRKTRRIGRLRSGRARAGSGRVQSNAKCRTASSSPTSACANTPSTGTAASRRRRGRQRPDRRAARPRGDFTRRSGRRHRGAVGHDGRPRRRHPSGARRARLRARGDHVVRGEVLLGVLRTVPRRGRFGARVRRSAHAPDGSGQCRRGAAGGRAGHRGGRRHRHGEACGALPRCRHAREGQRSAIRPPRIT